MKIGILTSSRADYGIYRPLLKALQTDVFFEMRLIVFGTHLSKKHGYTINEILEDGFSVEYQLNTFKENDTPGGIAQSIATVTSRFAAFWKKHAGEFDLIFCLGDRYEMFGAVQAGVPFNLPFAHIHGGETTRGAIDNIFRHCITLMSQYHFTSHKNYAARVRSITDSTDHIYNVGAPGLDNLQSVFLLTKEQIDEKYKIDLSMPTILFTFHPETVKPDQNQQNIEKIVSVLEKNDKYQVVITGTNTDTHSNVIRNKLEEFARNNPDRVFSYESLGTRGYYSFMNHCSFLMGNTSSGIIEAASFGKYVINLGKRQQGRIAGENVIQTAINSKAITEAIERIEDSGPPEKENIYWQGGASERIIEILKIINS